MDKTRYQETTFSSLAQTAVSGITKKHQLIRDEQKLNRPYFIRKVEVSPSKDIFQLQIIVMPTFKIGQPVENGKVPTKKDRYTIIIQFLGFSQLFDITKLIQLRPRTMARIGPLTQMMEMCDCKLYSDDPSFYYQGVWEDLDKVGMAVVPFIGPQGKDIWHNRHKLSGGLADPNVHVTKHIAQISLNYKNLAIAADKQLRKAGSLVESSCSTSGYYRIQERSLKTLTPAELNKDLPDVLFDMIAGTVRKQIVADDPNLRTQYELLERSLALQSKAAPAVVDAIETALLSVGNADNDGGSQYMKIANDALMLYGTEAPTDIQRINRQHILDTSNNPAPWKVMVPMVSKKWPLPFNALLNAVSKSGSTSMIGRGEVAMAFATGGRIVSGADLQFEGCTAEIKFGKGRLSGSYVPSQILSSYVLYNILVNSFAELRHRSGLETKLNAFLRAMTDPAAIHDLGYTSDPRTGMQLLQMLASLIAMSYRKPGANGLIGSLSDAPGLSDAELLQIKDANALAVLKSIGQMSFDWYQLLRFNRKNFYEFYQRLDKVMQEELHCSLEDRVAFWEHFFSLYLDTRFTTLSAMEDNDTHYAVAKEHLAATIYQQKADGWSSFQVYLTTFEASLAYQISTASQDGTSSRYTHLILLALDPQGSLWALTFKMDQSFEIQLGNAIKAGYVALSMPGVASQDKNVGIALRLGSGLTTQPEEE